MRKETVKLIDQGKAAKDRIDNVERKVTETLAEVKDKFAIIEKKVDKIGEKKEEASMAQKRDKEAGELLGAKADASE